MRLNKEIEFFSLITVEDNRFWVGSLIVVIEDGCCWCCLSVVFSNNFDYGFAGKLVFNIDCKWKLLAVWLEYVI